MVISLQSMSHRIFSRYRSQYVLCPALHLAQRDWASQLASSAMKSEACKLHVPPGDKRSAAGLCPAGGGQGRQRGARGAAAICAGLPVTQKRWVAENRICLICLHYCSPLLGPADYRQLCAERMEGKSKISGKHGGFKRVLCASF